MAMAFEIKQRRLSGENFLGVWTASPGNRRTVMLRLQTTNPTSKVMQPSHLTSSQHHYHIFDSGQQLWLLDFAPALMTDDEATTITKPSPSSSVLPKLNTKSRNICCPGNANFKTS